MAVFTKSRFAQLTAELVGTGVLTLIVLTVAQVTGGIGYYISFAVGIVLALLVITLGVVSGGHFNPAITLGLWTVRKVATLKAILYVAVQLIGGILAYLLFKYLLDTELSVPATDFDARVLVAETVGTAILAFAVAAAVFQKLSAGASAFAIGAGVTVGILIASTVSSAFLNPAIALGAQSFVLATYVLGPVLGAILGINLYSLIFAASDKPSLKAKAAGVRAVEEVEITEVVVSAPAKKAPAKKAAATKKPAVKKAPAKKPAAKKTPAKKK